MSHTPGPWVWEKCGSGCFENIYLRTPDRGKLIVMDFVRMGMQGAQPRFAKWEGENRERLGGIMYPAKELDLNDHPDARLIAAAPEMEQEIIRLRAQNVELRNALGGALTLVIPPTDVSGRRMYENGWKLFRDVSMSQPISPLTKSDSGGVW